MLFISPIFILLIKFHISSNCKNVYYFYKYSVDIKENLSTT